MSDMHVKKEESEQPFSLDLDFGGQDDFKAMTLEQLEQAANSAGWWSSPSPPSPGTAMSGLSMSLQANAAAGGSGAPGAPPQLSRLSIDGSRPGDPFAQRQPFSGLDEGKSGAFAMLTDHQAQASFYGSGSPVLALGGGLGGSVARSAGMSMVPPRLDTTGNHHSTPFSTEEELKVSPSATSAPINMPGSAYGEIRDDSNFDLWSMAGSMDEDGFYGVSSAYTPSYNGSVGSSWGSPFGSSAGSRPSSRSFVPEDTAKAFQAFREAQERQGEVASWASGGGQPDGPSPQRWPSQVPDDGMSRLQDVSNLSLDGSNRQDTITSFSSDRQDTLMAAANRDTLQLLEDLTRSPTSPQTATTQGIIFSDVLTSAPTSFAAIEAPTQASVSPWSSATPARPPSGGSNSRRTSGIFSSLAPLSIPEPGAGGLHGGESMKSGTAQLTATQTMPTMNVTQPTPLTARPRDGRTVLGRSPDSNTKQHKNKGAFSSTHAAIPTSGSGSHAQVLNFLPVESLAALAFPLGAFATQLTTAQQAALPSSATTPPPARHLVGPQPGQVQQVQLPATAFLPSMPPNNNTNMTLPPMSSVHPGWGAPSHSASVPPEAVYNMAQTTGGYIYMSGRAFGDRREFEGRQRSTHSSSSRLDRGTPGYHSALAPPQVGGGGHRRARSASVGRSDSFFRRSPDGRAEYSESDGSGENLAPAPSSRHSAWPPYVHGYAAGPPMGYPGPSPLPSSFNGQHPGGRPASPPGGPTRAPYVYRAPNDRDNSSQVGEDAEGEPDGDFGEARASKTTPATIEAALRRRNPGTEAKFVCELCGETFTRRYNLKGHQRAHRGEKPFACSYDGCDKAFARAHDCKRHEMLHLGVRRYVCTPCHRDFVRLDALQRHHRTAAGQACVAAIREAGYQIPYSTALATTRARQRFDPAASPAMSSEDTTTSYSFPSPPTLPLAFFPSPSTSASASTSYYQQQQRMSFPLGGAVPNGMVAPFGSPPLPSFQLSFSAP